MAGIEVAGLVLGVLPFLLKSVDAYRDGFRRFGTAFKKRKHVEKLARALLLQQQTLEELIKSVALASGCEDVWALDTDPIGYLENPEVQQQVERYLGPKHTIFLMGELEANHETIKKVARCISGLVPSGQGRTDDLAAIINANQDNQNLLADLAPRIKLMLGITDMKAMIQEIDEGSQTLYRFSKLALSNCRAMGSHSSKKTMQLAKAFRKIRRMAGGLYEAVLDGFMDECHDNHEARLYLDDRIEFAHEILHQRGKIALEKPQMTFDLVFQASGKQGEMLFYETAVRVFDEDPMDNSNFTVHPATTAVTFFVTQAPPTGPLRPQIANITSICSTIQIASGVEPRLAFALLENWRMGTFPDDGTYHAHRTHPKGLQRDCISLGHILTNATTLLPFKPRMQLSLHLASSLLQLLQTQWLAHTWSKDMVFFPIPCTPSGLTSHAHHVDLSRPFVACKFSGDNKPPQAGPASRTDPKSALLELGILLLEIWHGTTLEAQFAASPPSATYYARLAQALEWQDDDVDPMLGFYAQAVAHCLTGNTGAAGRGLDWEDVKLWSAVCADVIEPLSKLCENF